MFSGSENERIRTLHTHDETAKSDNLSGTFLDSCSELRGKSPAFGSPTLSEASTSWGSISVGEGRRGAEDTNLITTSSGRKS